MVKERTKYFASYVILHGQNGFHTRFFAHVLNLMAKQCKIEELKKLKINDSIEFHALLSKT